MRKLALFFSLCVALCTSAIAQSSATSSDYQERLKIAEQIMALSGSPGDMSKVVGSILPTTRQSIVDQARLKNPSLTETQLKRVGDKYMEVITPSINKFMLEIIPTLNAGLAKSHADKFSLSELEAIYKFQSSELGRRLQAFTMNEMPEMMKPMMAASQKMGADAGAAFVRIQQELAQESIVLK
jgi:hypothetical protein